MLQQSLALGLALSLSIASLSATVSYAKNIQMLTKKTTVTEKKEKKLELKPNGVKIKKVNWKSSNKKIVTVKPTGTLSCKIKGVKKGNATITASVSYKTGLKKSMTQKLKCNVTVKATKKKAIKLTHTYKTRCSKLAMVDCPTFQFNYPKNWKITSEKYNKGADDVITEQDVLSNNRGVTITYTSYNCVSLDGYGQTMVQLRFSKVAKSKFVPTDIGTAGDTRSDLGPCMVAKVEEIGSLNMATDTDFTKHKKPSVSYAIVPVSRTGVMDGIVGLSGLEEARSFGYPSLYSFVAEAPNGKFTKQEEKEVIAILSSFCETF